MLTGQFTPSKWLLPQPAQFPTFGVDDGRKVSHCDGPWRLVVVATDSGVFDPVGRGRFLAGHEHGPIDASASVATRQLAVKACQFAMACISASSVTCA